MDIARRDAKTKSRLGRGLSSMMGIGSFEPVMEEVPQATDTPVVPRGTTNEIPLEQIDVNPRQPRRVFMESALAELAESVRQHGVIQPILVRQHGDRYELIAGERRLRASRLAGKSTIPAVVRTTDELEQAQLALVENIQREDLNPIDRATGYRTLIDELGLTQADLAARLNEDRSTIANHLRLLDLAPAAVDLIRAGRLSLGHAKVLAGVHDHVKQSSLAERVVEQGLSVRALEALIAAPAKAESEPAKMTPSAHLRDLEVNLTKQLGMRVQVKAGANKQKGRVVIHYASLDEFDALMEKVGLRVEE